jgi:hypothetical protein
MYPRAESATLAAFQYLPELLPLLLETGKSNMSNQQEPRNTNRKSEKQILMGQMRKEDKLQTEDIREWLVSTLDATQ